jgi:bacteriocin biosynthesis cyclodehydratase domain-containing protein
MRPVLRPGLRLVRALSGEPVLVDGDQTYALDAAAADLLAGLDGQRHVSAVLGAEPDATARLAWARLADAQVVVDAEAPAALARSLGDPVPAAALREASALVAVDPAGAPARWARRRAATVTLVGTGAVTAPLAALLHEAGLRRARRDHTSAPAAADLTVLVHDHEPPVDLVEHLTRESRTHLVAGRRGTRAVVGPLVRPGSTPCLRCTDLARGAESPGWARVREPLSHPTPSGVLAEPVSAALVAAVAAAAAAEVLAYVEGAAPALTATTATFGPASVLPVLRSWATQPACGCSWQAETASSEPWTS